MPLEDNIDDKKYKVFENFENKAIEHFCAQTLMAMTSQMFDIIKKITPEMTESPQELKAMVDVINQEFVDDFMPEDALPDVLFEAFGIRQGDKMKDPLPVLMNAISILLRRLGARWSKLNQQFLVMKDYLKKEFHRKELQETAIIQLSNMLSFLIKRPEWLFNYAPHLALNERLCKHLAENFDTNRLNTKVSII